VAVNMKISSLAAR